VRLPAVPRLVGPPGPQPGASAAGRGGAERRRLEGGPIRRGNFNKMSAWPQAVASIGMTGLHFHDLRHTGNQFAANSGAALRDLMARMGHDSERAAMIYQHEARGADKTITNAIDEHVEDEKRKLDDEGDATGTAG
jgi:integrase